VRTIVPGAPLPKSQNPGPIADGGPALDQARAKLVDARITLSGLANTGLYSKRLMQVYLQTKHAASDLVTAAADPRTGHVMEFGSAADLAAKAASMIGQAIKGLKADGGGIPSAQLRDLTNKRLRAAEEVLGMAYIGAFTGTEF
jgi:hypothetical protein